MTAAAAAPARGACVLLGSGALYDAPVAALRERFDKVVLADVAHPPQARWAALRSGVTLAPVDLSGTLAALARLRPGEEPPPPRCDAFLDDDVALVVSLNLASQIALPAMDWLETRLGWSADRASAYGRAMIAAHLAHLRSFSGVRLLISDYALWEYDADDRRSPAEDTLSGQTPAAPPCACWEWRLAPPGELHRHRGVGLSVGAWRFDTA